MKRLNRYLASTIMQSTLVAMILLLGLETFFALVNEVRYVGTGDYQLLDAASFLIFQMPQRLYQMFPMSVLLGSIMGLGLLASNNEIVAMRGAGISYFKIMRSVCFIGMLMAIMMWLVGEFVAPASDRIAQNQRAFALSGGQALMTEQGTWMRDGHDFVHISILHVNNFVEGVTRYEFDDNLRLKKASYAAQGVRKDDHWVLYNVRETIIDENQLTVKKTPELKWYSSLDSEVLRVVGMKYLDQLSLNGLAKAIEYRTKNNLEVQSYQYAFWEKCVQPLVVMAMILLGISTIFGPLRNANTSMRMLAGMLMGFTFFVVNASLGPITILYGIPPYIAVMLPTVAVLLLCWQMLRRLP